MDFQIGDKVSKKSKKPFKNGEVVQIIEKLSANEVDPKKRGCAVFSDDSICNLHMLTKEK